MFEMGAGSLDQSGYQNKTARLLRNLLSFGVDVAAIQETQFATSILVCRLNTLQFVQHTETVWSEGFLVNEAFPGYKGEHYPCRRGV